MMHIDKIDSKSTDECTDIWFCHLRKYYINLTLAYYKFRMLFLDEAFQEDTKASIYSSILSTKLLIYFNYFFFQFQKKFVLSLSGVIDNS